MLYELLEPAGFARQTRGRKYFLQGSPMSEHWIGPLRTPAPRARFLLPLLMFVFGSLITYLTWWQVREEMRTNAAAGLADLAEESRGTIQDRVEKHLFALRSLGRFWQLYGLREMPVWRFDSGMVIDNFKGISWIAWISATGDSVRYVARDSAWAPTPALIADAVRNLEDPTSEITLVNGEVPALRVLFPVRTPEFEVGTLAAEIRPDSLLGGAKHETARNLAFTARTEDGTVIVRRGSPAADVPSWLREAVKISLSSAGAWIIEIEPTEEYLARAESQWPQYVLLTGLLLSVGIGAIALQILRVRGYSAALARTNASLDARLHELTDRDRDLRRLNEELETRVEQRTAELRDAMSELEAFSHSISHDLRSPVGAVVNYTSILEEDYGDRLDEEGRRVLQRIQKSSASAIALLDDLVKLARAGREEPVRERVTMTELARRSYEVAAASEEDVSNVQFEVDALPDAWGDPALVERVFTNLISNSLKYTRERERRMIRVTGANGGDQNAYSVEDNGVGFDPEAAASVFQPFTRLHSSQRFQGTGLGLAIVARIVRRLGGKVAAESDGKSGARFSFTLPTVRATP
jgi:signal transduction histidine kinase